MSCQKNRLICTAGATRSGISKIASSAAGSMGSAARQAAKWADANQETVKAATAGTATIGRMAAKVAKERLYQNETGQLAESGVQARIERIDLEIPEHDLAVTSEVDHRLAQLQHYLGSPVFSKVSISGDRLTTANAMHRATVQELKASGGLANHVMANLYQALKPVIVGRQYLRQRAGLLSERKPMAVNLKSGELVVNTQYIKDPQAAAYNVIVAGLQKAQIDTKGKISPRQQRINAIKMRHPSASVEAAARLMLGPHAQTPKKYRLASRVAEWHARRIGQITGRDPIEVLLKGMKIQSGVRPTVQRPTPRDVFRPTTG
jgi:hypothetical protein